MRRLRNLCGIALVLLAGLPGISQAQQEQGGGDPMMVAMMAAMKTGEAHQALMARAGAWTMTSSFWMDPSQPPMVTTGTVTREPMLGGRVLVEKVKADMMGMAFEGYGMIGYDNVTGKYWTTWNDNMSTALVAGTGSRQADGKLVFDLTINDPMTKETVKVRTVVTETADTEAMEWFETRGGKEVKTMEIKYARAK